MKKKLFFFKEIYLRKSFLSNSILKISIAFILPLLFITGCKKVLEEPGITGICPAVISTVPVSGAAAAPLNTLISATFNESIDSTTLNSSSFFIKQGNTNVAGIISYVGMTAIFTPASNLLPNTVYTGTITTGVRDKARNSPKANFVWTFTTGVAPDTIPPRVISTDPNNGDVNVLATKVISATFSKVMNPATINAATFTLRQGTTLVSGLVTYTASTASFAPTTNLAFNTTYIATITTGAKDMAGNAIVNNYVWSFTTGVAPADVTAPFVVSTDPANAATGVAISKVIAANFNKAMNPTTINTTTFLLMQGTTPVAGSIIYSGTTASFTPSANLIPNSVYTATITTGAKDVAGNALANNYTWSFTTGTAIASPFLGSAALFGAFGGNSGITNQGLNTVIDNGSIGTTAASTLITGFHDGTTGDVYTETPLNTGLVTGRIYTAPPFPGSSTSAAIAAQGLADATVLYNSISPAGSPGGTDPGAGELGGLTLAPGTYKSASGTFKITNGNLTLDAKGDPNAVWKFQTDAGLTVGVAGPAGARSVLLINGGLAKNVFWYVGSAAVINGAGGGVMTGNIISSAGVTFSTAGNAVQTVLNGRAISLNASITMVNTTVNVP